MAVFKRALWIGKRAVIGHALTCCVFVGVSAFSHDVSMEQRWRGATHAVVKSEGLFSRARALTTEERECLEAWLELMRFHVEPNGNLKKFSVRCALNDSLIFFDGLSECTDGFTFLSKFYTSSEPVVTELRREEVKGVISLHAKLLTEAQFRFVPLRYVFSSTVTLELEDYGGLLAAATDAASSVGSPGVSSPATVATGGTVRSLSGKKRIRCAEHRWFGGPIVSRFTRTFKNSYGDMGDLFRRFNGFTLATVVTNSEHLAR